MKPSKKDLSLFQALVWNYYRSFGRKFSWRNVNNPYYVLVSEIMLQQTQTHRVIEKYEYFTAVFPTLNSLADASLREVLSVWQGLGYNRRGKYLHECAKKVVREFGGVLPDDPELLKTFPGIGPGTAGSICAFAFNKPTVFIETNIRAVFIHSFFHGKVGVHDNDLIPLIAAVVDQENPREWYYALMDYGVMLKKQHPNPSRKSIHHSKQSRFEGSDRQIRGMIIKLLTENPQLTQKKLQSVLKGDGLRMKKILNDLISENMIKIIGGTIQIC